MAENVVIKILPNPNDPDLTVVPVHINGKEWLIQVGKQTEVPKFVAKLLENAGYI